MVGNLNKCRRQMPPVTADHRLLRLTFYIAGEQDAGATIIDPHHTGMIVTLAVLPGSGHRAWKLSPCHCQRSSR